MRRVGGLWPEIVTWENLFLASREARRGKRSKLAVQDFEGRLEENLVSLQRDLVDGRFEPGPYHDFLVHEPKLRRISAACYRDRVVHHATLKERLRRVLKCRPTLELVDRIVAGP